MEPDINALRQRMTDEAHEDVLPGDSHVTAMEAIKGEFGLRLSATTTPQWSTQSYGCSRSMSEDANATKIARAGHCPRAEAEIETAISKMSRRR